jgi:hypothetical protein
MMMRPMKKTLTILFLINCALASPIKRPMPLIEQERLKSTIERKGIALDLPLNATSEFSLLLQHFHIGTNWNEVELKAIAKVLGIQMQESLNALSQELRIEGLSKAIDDYTKLPLTILITLKKRKEYLHLVGESITTHPELHYLSGVIPRGHKVTWDEIPGVGASHPHPTVIVVDKQGAAHHGSQSLVLHEMGHTIDRYLKNSNNAYDYSSSKNFQLVHQNTSFSSLYGEDRMSYFSNYTEENFAELFALYFDSPESRQYLELNEPKAYNWFEQNF